MVYFVNRGIGKLTTPFGSVETFFRSIIDSSWPVLMIFIGVLFGIIAAALAVRVFSKSL